MEFLKKIDWKSLLFNLFMPIALSFIVTMLIGDYSDFYNSLNKPINVPGSLFGIVWSVLYLLMGLSSYIVFEKNTTESKNAYYLYWISLFVNILWPVFFFGFKLILFSSIWLLLLIVLVIFVMKKYKRINNLSFYLLIPYLVWNLFALYLNVSIYILNS